jgi:hypothetical protein
MTPLTHIVTSLIAVRIYEGGTVDHLMPLLSGYTRRQVIKALQNARLRGYLECDGRGPRQGRKSRGSDPGTYRWTEDCPPVPKVDLQAVNREQRARQRVKDNRQRPVSSVFELGGLRNTAGY